MANWFDDHVIVLGVGVSKEDTEKIKEAIKIQVEEKN